VIKRLTNGRQWRSKLFLFVGCTLISAPVSSFAQGDRANDAHIVQAVRAPIATEDDCRRFAVPACAKLGEKVTFSLKTGRGGTQPGNPDPFWKLTNGSVVNVINTSSGTPSAWFPNGNAAWIGPTTRRGGTFTYIGQLWIPEDPYSYDKLITNLNIGADNTVVAVRINGVQVHLGNGGIRDFQNFDVVTVDSSSTGAPFKKGCNKIEIEINNQSNITGISVRGTIKAKCSKCTTPNPALKRFTYSGLNMQGGNETTPCPGTGVDYVRSQAPTVPYLAAMLQNLDQRCASQKSGSKLNSIRFNSCKPDKRGRGFGPNAIADLRCE